MADNVPILDSTGATRTIAADDVSGVLYEALKVAFGADGAATLVSAGSPLPVTDAAVATQTTAAAILAKLSADPATQTTLAAILASVDGLEGFTDGIEGALGTLNGKDFATQTTLAAVLAKLTTTAAAPLATRLSDGSSYIGTTSSRLHVDDGGSSLTVDGTVAATIAAQGPWTYRDIATGSGAATVLRGVAIRETSGTAGAVVRLRDANVSGAILVPVSLSAGESTRESFGPSGLTVPSGTLFTQVVSGAVEGSVFI